MQSSTKSTFDNLLRLVKHFGDSYPAGMLNLFSSEVGFLIFLIHLIGERHDGKIFFMHWQETISVLYNLNHFWWKLF